MNNQLHVVSNELNNALSELNTTIKTFQRSVDRENNKAQRSKTYLEIVALLSIALACIAFI